MGFFDFLFGGETEGERHTRFHNEGAKDASESEDTMLGETNRNTPFLGVGEQEKADNEAYTEGFDHVKGQRK